MSKQTTTIVINAVTTAINALVDHSLTYAAACETVKAHRESGKLDDKTARQYIQAALLAKVSAYKAQVTETGKPAPGSAYQRAVTRLMADTSPAKASSKPVETILVPAAIQALAAKMWALCAEYEGAAKLAATALANAKAGK